jgi:drug/metabolite transporter (DMT)-like permease
VTSAAVALAAISALVWGSADYCGGRAAQRVSALPVTVVSQIYGLPVLALAVLLVPGTPHLGDVGWAAGAGVCGFFGIVLLYRSLSTGAMAIAAPITAVTGAVVPVVAGLLLEQSPSAITLVGVGCAVAAIGLVSLGPRSGGRATPQVIGVALLAGAMFGLFFVLLAQTSDGSGMWPLVVVRSVSIPLGLALVVMRGATLRMPRRLTGWLIGAGVGDIGANALYLLAAREGLLSVVAPIAALYPVSTVLLALAVDKERVRPIQIAGLGLAATALVLTAV